MVEEKYNGWKNYSTWNVSLWIGNDEQLYRSACEFVRKYKGKAVYPQFIRSMGLEHDKTPDGVKWISTTLDYPALNKMMRELVE
jgi:hypothetical protein